MRIVIDMQGAQSASRGRGIGRYSMSLVDAVVRHRGEHDVILALNGLFDDTIAPIRRHFAGMLPKQNIRVWHAAGPVRECDAQTQTTMRREAAELVREAFLASLRPDVIHVTSLIEGYMDDSVTCIGRFDQHTPVSVSFYDLIPLVYRDHYLTPDPLYNRYYLKKLEHMRRADLLLAISESSRGEAIELLNYPETQVVNVSTAADAHFRPLAIDDAEKQALLARYGIRKPFVMYTGATDSRKNVEGLIGAYALLPESLRSSHQLLIVSHLHANERQRLETLAGMRYLSPDDVVLPGYAPDEDLVKLYNLCRLFVMPSWHEGFGLPVLEAMSCGRAAIASNASSLPEVVGRADALFDAKSERAIADKMAEALSNDAWRAELEAHGLERARMFSWDASAQRAIAAFEELHARRRKRDRVPQKEAPAAKKTLAYVSPLPPERTGIANYSAELLPALREHYDITLVTDQEKVDLPSSLADLPVQTASWLAQHADRFDRVIYQVGNSPFHSHMPELMHRHPGVLVMHDFFNSSMLAADELEQRQPHCWSDALYHSHGYPALAVRYDDKGQGGIVAAKDRFPCNLSLLQDAAGVIVHSAHSARLAGLWYGEQASADWAPIPHLRVATPIPDRAAMRRAARDKLGLQQDIFLVCSFGFIAPTKLTHRLLEAWLQSALHGNRHCGLVLVGENHGGDYGGQLVKRIRQSGAEENVRIAGWTEMRDYELYLQAADISVQLRCLSRGETSGAVLDCMNHALPTIVNAHGSMADLPEGAVWKLDDEFADADLVAALETLWRDTDKRDAFAREARRQITTVHDPAHCARLYADAIERFHPQAAQGTAALITHLGNSGIRQEGELRRLANAVALSIAPQPRVPQLMIDVSAICRADLQSGIERVVRAQLSALLDKMSPNYRVEPVYLHTADGAPHYRYARRYTHGLLGIPDIAPDSAVDVTAGDVFYGADFCPDDVQKSAGAGIYRRWRGNGASVHFLVHDILPVTRPEFFPDGAGDTHAAWLRAIAAEADSLICISQAVADETKGWLQSVGISAAGYTVLHHGADLDRSFPSSGLPEDAEQLLKTIRSGDSFLMVGTIEPRKGHLQAIEAFDVLWRDGVDAKLVIVGREGWGALPPEQRRNIPRTMEKLRHHPELGKRLIWLSDISDQYLEQVYQASGCLLFASEAEGFGLPLIEAARHGKPIIARDIAVFREIAGEHAHYFSGQDADALALAVKTWIALNKTGGAPNSAGLAWNTWSQNAECLLRLLGL